MSKFIQGLREGGAGGTMTPGAHELERGPIQMTLRSEKPIEVACEQLYFFWRLLDFGRKTVAISEKTFFLDIN